MAELNKITGIIVGQYGEAIILQIVDDNGVAVDVSSYTTSKTVTLRDRFGAKVLSYAATFVTTGSDGQIQFTPANGDIDRAGEWVGQVELETVAARAITVPFTVQVETRLAPST